MPALCVLPTECAAVDGAADLVCYREAIPVAITVVGEGAARGGASGGRGHSGKTLLAPLAVLQHDGAFLCHPPRNRPAFRAVEDSAFRVCAALRQVAPVSVRHPVELLVEHVTGQLLSQRG